ncbi:MAG: sigma-54 dependent transcriptional regulator [Ignavibacteria bacterium]
MGRILVVDDEATTIAILKKVLEDVGHVVSTVNNGEMALERINEFKYDVMITDFNMPGMNGIELTEKALRIEQDLIVILITAFATIRSAVDAIRIGAFDYLTKPINKEELLLALQRGLERIHLLRENILLKQRLESVEHSSEKEFEYLTANKEVREMLNEVRKVANTESTILITGSNGTGKEVLSKYIHKMSNRKNQQFVVLNCAALPPQLLESELFGHVKGSFTGAVKDRKGYFEIADNGTIFLDEIGEIDPVIQVKLLRVLQEREFSKVGDTRIQSTNVRVIAATNKDIKQLIAEGKFREDLYYRLNVFEFHLPSLKDRKEDIKFYFNKFITEQSIVLKKSIPVIDVSVENVLLNYEWPGNIRELKNVAERASILCDNGKITLDLLPSNILSNESKRNYSADYNENKENIIKDFEITFIKKYLKLCNGNVAATAKTINFHPVSLRQKLTKLGIDPRDYKY